MNKDRFSTLMALMTPDIINKIINKYGLDENKAIALFHKSEVYKTLEIEETKVWQYSSEMIVELFDREMNGKLEFPDTEPVILTVQAEVE